MDNISARTRGIALMGMLFALAMALGFFDSAIAGMLALPPGIRPGLSNIVVLFAIIALGGREGLILAVLKAAFAFLTRGAAAAALSLSGGLLSVAVMWLLARSKRLSAGYWVLGAAGGVAHNIGQLAAAGLLIQNHYLIYYLPVLIISGVFAGLLTGTVCRAAGPYFGRLLKVRKG